MSKARTDLFAMRTTEKQKIYNDFIRSLNDAGGFPTNGFNNYDAKRISNTDHFTEIKAPDGTKFNEKLKANTPDATAAKQAIDTALAAPDKSKYETAKKDFNRDLDNLNNFLKAGKYSLGDAGSYLLEAKNYAVSAIQTQQEQELENLNDRFTKDDVFKTQMKTALGCNNDTELETVKDEMISTLKKSHDEELNKFKKSLEDNANQLFKKAEQEYWRLTFLGQRYHTNKTFKKEIDEMAAELQDPGNLSTTTGLKGSARLKDIDPKNLQTHVTISGKDLKGNDNGSLSIDLGGWFETDDDAYLKLTSIAEELKARGSTTITYEISEKDPDKAAEIGKKAFESAIIAGFAPNQINITVNGGPKYTSKYNEKEKKYDVEDDLFKDDSQRLQFAKNKFNTMAKKRDVFLKGDKFGKLKAELQEMRKETAEQQQEQEQGQQLGN